MRQRGLNGPKLRTHVQIECKVPLLVGGIERRACMHKAGAVEQHVNGGHRANAFLNRGLVHHVEHRRVNVWHAGITCQQFFVHVGRPHGRAFCRQRQRAGFSNALAGRGNERGLSCQSHSESLKLSRVLPDVGQKLLCDYELV